MKQIADEVFEMVVSYGGSFSGEHGDGILRGEFVPRFYGPEIYEAFRDVKQLFDPQDLMNPGKIVDPVPMTSHLRVRTRLPPGSASQSVPLPRSGRLRNWRSNSATAWAPAASSVPGRCAPATWPRETKHHSTRGRANALRLAMSGQLGPDALTSDRIHDVLDLCLSCKACKSECPNSVDMSRLKADVLQWRYRATRDTLGREVDRGITRLAATGGRALGRRGQLAATATALRRWLGKMTGIDPRRPLPEIAREPLVRWFGRRKQSLHNDRARVLLFCDTFTNFMEPHVGRAAVHLLEHCGIRLTWPTLAVASGPPSPKGMLDCCTTARAKTLRQLVARQHQGEYESIVVLEPSCASSLIEDLPDLVDDATINDTRTTHRNDRWLPGPRVR